MSESTDETFVLGHLLFDGDCEFCVRSVNRVFKILTRRGVRPIPFANGAAEPEMRLRWHDGREFGGADAVVFLSARIWWAWPLRVSATLPGVRPLLRGIYRRIAANRHCRDGACVLPPPSDRSMEFAHLRRCASAAEFAPGTRALPRKTDRPTAKNRKLRADGGTPKLPPDRTPGLAHLRRCANSRLGWIVLFLLAAIAFVAGRLGSIGQGWTGEQTLLSQNVPAWIWMWMLAGALWGGFKLIAWLQAGGWKALGIRTFPFAAWVGMDASAFVEKTDPRNLPIGGALIRTMTGIALIWGIVPILNTPLLEGWLGMAGLLLVLHFGLFEITAAFWNRRGFPVRPIMESPWRARTLAEFWGERWNRAFSDIARASIFRPLVRRFGGPAGTLTGFAFSGLAHELVISLPAGGGYGLPTAYFLLQGAGVLAERRLGIRGTLAGRLMLWIVILGPAFWLFHPPFMNAVIHPFLETLETVIR